MHQKVKVPSAPPPRRSAAAAALGLGTAQALYDYEGAEVEDLPVAEGESVTVVEHGKHILSSVTGCAGPEVWRPRSA